MQKKEALKNWINVDVKQANGIAEIASKIINDEASIQETITIIKDLVDASANNDAKDDLNSIIAGNLEAAETIKAIRENESIKTICADLLKESALKDVDNFESDAQLEQAFEELFKNPAMAILLAEANPAISANIAAMKDPNAIFGRYGKPVDPASPFTK